MCFLMSSVLSTVNFEENVHFFRKLYEGRGTTVKTASLV